jgi:predicted ATP-grasp superfamily ATP-dependent carboligase
MPRAIDALVLDGTNHSSLAIVRNLGAHGLSIAVAAHTRAACGAASKYCREFLLHPSLDRDPRGAADAVFSYLDHVPDAVVFATSDRWHELIYADRDQVGRRRIPAGVPSPDRFHAACDKAETVLRADRLGIPVPATYLPESFAQMEQLARSIEYPLVVKPRRSVVTQRGQVAVTGGVGYARTPAELRESYRRISTRAPNPMIQRFVEGEGIGVFLLCDEGVPLLRFAHRRLRDVIPTGSASALRESIPYPLELGRQAESLAADLQWSGPMMVEFRVNARTAEAYLIEINGRFWGSLQLAIDAGQEFPFAHYELCRGRPRRGPDMYRVGIRSRWLVWDLQHLIRVMRGRPPEFPGAYPTRKTAVMNLLRPSGAGTRLECLSWSDPKPFFYEWVSYAARLVGRA